MIYFLQSPLGGSIKIGTTENLEVRLKQLEAHYGQPLALLATLEGGRDKEQAIHARFASHRLGRTEQFRPVTEIMAFIGRPLLVGADPDAVEMMEPATPKDFDPGRDDVAVKVDRTLVGRLKTIATFRGVSLAELVSEALRVPAGKMWNEMIRESDKEAK